MTDERPIDRPDTRADDQTDRAADDPMGPDEGTDGASTGTDETGAGDSPVFDPPEPSSDNNSDLR